MYIMTKIIIYMRLKTITLSIQLITSKNYAFSTTVKNFTFY